MSTRISARIDDDLARHLAQLGRQTGLTLTQLVETALRDLVARRQATDSAEVLLSVGFVGSGSGPRDLAENAKAYLRESMGKKA